MYIYGDETYFENSNKEKLIGTGVLYVQKPIENNIIQEALENLRKDLPNSKKEYKKRDLETLNREYFHASEDSPNARGHLCSVIQTHIKGKLHYSFHNVKESTEIDEDEIKHALMLSLENIFSINGQVCITIEGRSKFSDIHLDLLIEDMIRLNFLNPYQIPTVKMYLPKIKSTVKDKQNPGIQILDFILWAQQRHYSKPETDDWFERLNPSNTSLYPDKTINGGATHLNGYIEDSDELFYPRNVLDFFNTEKEVIDISLYQYIHGVVNQYSSSKLPSRIQHLVKYFIELENLVQVHGKTFKIIDQEIDAYIKLFLMLFDTLPLFNESSLMVEIQKLIKAKLFAIELLDQSSFTARNKRNLIMRKCYAGQY